jgi:hypothetical protein
MRSQSIANEFYFIKNVRSKSGAKKDEDESTTKDRELRKSENII